MHGSPSHLLFNMFALWMFGKTLENVWGAKRFLIYYMITGLGAAFIYILFIQYQIYGIANEFPDFLEACAWGSNNFLKKLPKRKLKKQASSLVL